MSGLETVENKISYIRGRIARVKKYQAMSRDHIETDDTLRSAIERELYVIAQSVQFEGEKIAEKGASPEIMRKYLYTFGYVTPGRPKGADLEDSREIFIIADSKEKALEWGKRLSEEYVHSLRQETEDIRVGKGAELVTPEEELRRENYADVPVIKYGERVNLRALFKELEERNEF